MMDTDKGLFIVNKKAKELRDILQFYKNNGKLKEFRILLGMLCGPGAEERLQETIITIRKRKKNLYALKYTFLKKFGKPVDASFKVNSYGFIETYLICEYMGHRYHMPATIDQIQKAGVEIPDHCEENSSLVPALIDTISEQALQEAIDTLWEAIGDEPLQEPPFNAIPANSSALSSLGVTGGVGMKADRVLIIRDLGKYRRYLASKKNC